MIFYLRAHVSPIHEGKLQSHNLMRHYQKRERFQQIYQPKTTLTTVRPMKRCCMEDEPSCSSLQTFMNCTRKFPYCYTNW